MSFVFSIAFNDYDKIWQSCLDTQTVYAKQFAYDYALVGTGVRTPLLMESAWLKIPLLIAALDKGHEWVLYIDADAAFSSIAPAFETVSVADKDIYLGNGHSGRPNSGVMIVRNTPTARAFFVNLLRNAGVALPREHSVGWGENGEVIHFLSTYPGFQLIDPRWNNNHTRHLADFIRHYSAGPMRRKFDFGDKAELRQKVISVVKTEDNRPGTRAFYAGIRALVAPCAGIGTFDVGPVLGELDTLIDTPPRGG